MKRPRRQLLYLASSVVLLTATAHGAWTSITSPSSYFFSSKTTTTSRRRQQLPSSTSILRPSSTSTTTTTRLALSVRIPGTGKNDNNNNKDNVKKNKAKKKDSGEAEEASSSSSGGGGGFFSRFSSSSSKDDGKASSSSTPRPTRKVVEEDEDDGSTGFFRGWFQRKDGDDDEDNDDAEARVESKKLKIRKEKAQAQREAAKKKQENALKKKEKERRKLAEKKLQKRKKEQEKRRKQQLKAKAEDEKEEAIPLGSRIYSIFTNNTLFNSTDKNATATAEVTTSKKKKGRSSNSTTSPLSVVQKFIFDRTIGGNKNPKEQWIVVFPKTRIMPGEMVPVTVAGLDLLVIASKDARQLYCIANACPHLGTPLETGRLVRLPVEEDANATAATTTPNPFIQPSFITENDVTKMLSQDGCEDCIVCPTHRTAFALQSGDVRGEWCPYPPVLGKMMGSVKKPIGAATFDVRTRGKNIEVRINTPLLPIDADTTASTAVTAVESSKPAASDDDNKQQQQR